MLNNLCSPIEVTEEMLERMERRLVKGKPFIPPSKPLIDYTPKETPSTPQLPQERAPLPALQTIGTTTKRPTKPVPVRKNSKPVFVPQFGPEDIMSDEEFIRLTRTRTYSELSPDTHSTRTDPTVHDPRIAKAFWANGGWERDELTGQRFYQKYDTIAQAFDALRQHKLAKLAGVKPGEYNRINKPGNDWRVFVPGTALEAAKVRDQAQAEREQNLADDAWMHRPLNKVG